MRRHDGKENRQLGSTSEECSRCRQSTRLSGCGDDDAIRAIVSGIVKVRGQLHTCFIPPTTKEGSLVRFITYKIIYFFVLSFFSKSANNFLTNYKNQNTCPNLLKTFFLHRLNGDENRYHPPSQLDLLFFEVSCSKEQEREYSFGERRECAWKCTDFACQW
jgi:hypothetical protein